jgi:RNA polymerase sigma-70 factor (ECF subfamily)
MPLDVNQIWMQVHLGLRGFIARRVTQDAEVDDLLQEVFLRMHRGLDKLKDPRRVVSWIYQISRNVISDYYRSSTRQREIAVGSAADLEASYSTPDLPLISESHESESIRKEIAACLLPMIKQLPDRYGEALTLVELNGLTQKAAADQVGLSLSGMKSRVQRGRKELKSLIEECCDLELDRRGTITDYSVRHAGCKSCEPSQN